MNQILIASILVVLIIIIYLRTISTEKMHTEPDIQEGEINMRKDWDAVSYANAKILRDKAAVDDLNRKAMLPDATLNENIIYYSDPGCRPVNCQKIESHEDEDYMYALGKQLISPEMEASHNEFVREDAAVYGTGRLLTDPDSHDSYVEAPWVGIMGRPQNVPVGSPDQLTNVDRRQYADKQRIYL